MSYFKEFNVLMQQYGDSGGGGSDGGTNVFNLTNAAIDDSFDFVDTPYRFTDPPRYYKANDPYYYAVDNLPLKEIHENCLWLKDQLMGLDTDVTGISTAKLTDLQPWVTNADRVVYVRPGKFTARINDAYSASPENFWATFAQGATTIDLARSPIYNTPTVSINNSTFSTIVGNEVEQLLYSNGLYEHYQHHASVLRVEPPVFSADVPEGPVSIVSFLGPTFLTTAALTIAQLPKIKTAVWQQKSNTTFLEEPYKPDLQQLSVDFCRRWKGVFRTAIVNSLTQQSLSIPLFDDSDYIDTNTAYDPQVRIDLIFMYAHPIDRKETHLAHDAGDGPERITAPRLGLIKGAGSILIPRGATGDSAMDIINNPDLIGNTDWSSQEQNPDKYYDTAQQLSDLADMSIQSPLSDQLGLGTTNAPFGEGITTGYSFPSPDDLLNLAPILADNALGGELNTIGQSVLPLCYVIVKRDSPSILAEDVIDIRPFLRTAELTYNERAGVAAANPPLSLANPATGRYELFANLEAMRDFLIKYTDIQAGDIAGQFASQAVVPKPRFNSTLFISDINGNQVDGDGKLMPIYNSANINCDLVNNWPLAFEEYATPSAISAPADGEEFVELIPGVYSIDYQLSMIDRLSYDGRCSWVIEVVDYSTGGVLAPTPSQQAMQSTSVGGYNISAGGTDPSSAALHLQTFLTLHQKTFVSLKVTSSVSHSTGGRWRLIGSATIERQQNVDGTEGSIH